MMKILNKNIGIFAALFSAGMTTQIASAETFNANIFFPDQHPLAKHGYVEWAEAINSASEGSLEANLYTGTVLLPARSGLSGVRDGLAQVGYAAGTYTPAELPISNALQELGFNYDDPLVMVSAASDFNMNNPEALAQWKKAGVIYGGGYSTPPYNLMCNTPIQSVEDLKGKRIRTSGAALSRWAETIGAVPVNVPSSEMYQGVEKGTLDCAVNVASDLKSRSLWDVAKHTTMAPLGLFWSGPMWAYNPKFWESISEDDRRIFMNANADALAKLYVGYAGAVTEALDEAKEHGVTVYQPDEAFLSNISGFAKDNLDNVYETARNKYEIDDPEALLGAFDQTIKKWESLYKDVDRTDANAIAIILKENLYDGVDVATYGLN
jgi:TRAP-type C4-dicarboxylate transport system substrate-binding protein